MAVAVEKPRVRKYSRASLAAGDRLLQAIKAKMLREKGKVEGEQLDCPRWDMTVKAINQFDNPDLYFQKKQGVFVYGEKYPGNANDANLARNDNLVKIDDKAGLPVLDGIVECLESAVGHFSLVENQRAVG